MTITLPQPITFGDTSGDARDHTQIAAETISPSPPGEPGNLPLFSLVGDASTLFGHAVGGHNTLSINAFATPDVVGDATVTDHAVGGNNQVGADVDRGEITVLTAYGDAETMSGHASVGDDHVSANAEGPAIA